jgi:hypothetical protein
MFARFVPSAARRPGLINALAVRAMATSASTSSSLIRVRAPAPDFSAQAVVNGDFKNVSLKDYKGKWLVLFFYPLTFTFVCPTEVRRSLVCRRVKRGQVALHRALCASRTPRVAQRTLV